MATIIIEPPTQTVTLRLLSDETLPILQHLERAHLLEIIPDVPAPLPNAAEWAGKLSPEEVASLRKHAGEIRAEWDRDF